LAVFCAPIPLLTKILDFLVMGEKTENFGEGELVLAIRGQPGLKNRND